MPAPREKKKIEWIEGETQFITSAAHTVVVGVGKGAGEGRVRFAPVGTDSIVAGAVDRPVLDGLGAGDGDRAGILQLRFVQRQ